MTKREIKRTLTVFAAVTAAAVLFAGCVKGPENTPVAPEISPAPSPAVETPVQPPEPVAPGVECALDYSKQAVDMFDPETTFDWLQQVRLPRLTLDSANAEAFNARIMEYAQYAELLQNGEEENALYNITYQYSINGNIVGIILVCVYGYQYSEAFEDYAGFYYDAEQDRELTWKEYAEALGADPEELMRRAEEKLMQENEWYSSTQWGDAILFDGTNYLVEVTGVSEEGMDMTELVTL